MADDLCPECGGTVTPSLHVCDGHEHTSSTTCNRCDTVFGELIELVCETCQRRRMAPPAFARTGHCLVAEALETADANGSAWERFAEIGRWSTDLRDDPDCREVVYTPTADRHRIVVGADLSVRRASPQSPEFGTRLDE